MRTLVACALLLGCAAAARADDGLRCGEWLVTVGAGQEEVAAKCGPPTNAATRHERRRVRGQYRQRTIDVWTYDRGSTEFVRTLTFTDGVLGDVTVGDYGGR